MNYRKLTAEQIMGIPKLIDEGQTYKQISASLKVSVRAIAYWVAALKRAGVRVNSRPGPKLLKLN